MVDLTPALIAWARTHPDELLFALDNTHWTPTGVERAVEELMPEIEKRLKKF